MASDSRQALEIGLTCFECGEPVPIDAKAVGWIEAELDGDPPQPLWLCPDCAEKARRKVLINKLLVLERTRT